MAIVHGTLARPLEDVAIATRQVAAQQGYLLSEGESVLGVLMFKKGVTFFSWGSQLKVSLDTGHLPPRPRSPSRPERRLPLLIGAVESEQRIACWLLWGQNSTRRTCQLLGVSRQRVQQLTESDPDFPELAAS